MASEAVKGGVVFNGIYRRAFIRWRAQMQADLRAQGYNTIKSAWSKVGLGLLLDKECEMWTAAIRLFGADSMLGLAQQAVDVAASAAARAAAAGDQGGVGAAGEGGVGATPAVEGGDQVMAMHARSVTARERLDAEKKDRLLTLLRNLGVGDSVALGHHQQPPHDVGYMPSGAGGVGSGGSGGSGACEEPGMATHKPARPKKAATVVGALGLVRITPKDEHEHEIELTHKQLEDAMDPAVVSVCVAYEIFADYAAINQEDAKRRKKVRAKQRRLERGAIAEQARSQYNADWAQEQKRLLDALLLTSDGTTVGNEAKVRLEEIVKQHMERTRELAEKPPCRIINGHLVYDAVGLVEPLVLTRALMDAVGAALAQRAAAAVEQTAKPKKQRAGPQDRPTNFAGTTGAAAVEHLEKRDEKRKADQSADAQKKATAQAKRGAKKAAEEAKLKENAVAALKMLIEQKGQFSSKALSRHRRCLLLRCYGAVIPGGVKVLPKDGTMDKAAEAAWAAVKPNNLPAALLQLVRDAKAGAAAGVGAGASTTQIDETAAAAGAEDGAESEKGEEGDEEEEDDEHEDEDDEDEDDGDEDEEEGGGLRVTTRSAALKAAAPMVQDDDDSVEEDEEVEEEDEDDDEDDEDEEDEEDEEE